MATVVGFVVSFSSSSFISRTTIRSTLLPFCYNNITNYITSPLLHFNPFFSSSSSLLRAKPIMSMSKTNTDMIDTTTMLGLHCEDDYDEHKKNIKRWVLLLDIMDTVVRDPFYQDIPAFFGMSLKELIECKHPTAWIDFETGLIDETELARIFFKDGRPFDLEGLKSCMRRGFSYLQGMEELLHVLKRNNYEMHALTNYPIWYEMIEDKLKLSEYLSWSFCSCSIGKRKPDPELYAEVVRRLDVEPENCIFIDDRMRNVEAAMAAGMVGLQFKDAKTLQKDLSLLGIQTEYQDF